MTERVNPITRSSANFKRGMRVMAGNVTLDNAGNVAGVGGDVVEAQRLLTGATPFYRVTMGFVFDRNRLDIAITHDFFSSTFEGSRETSLVDDGGDVRDDTRDLDFVLLDPISALPTTPEGILSLTVLKGA